MAGTRVVHKSEPHDVYVGRPSIYGNPYSHKAGTAAKFRVASRAEAIARYETWLLAQPGLVALVQAELTGKVLGCWCRPKEGFQGRLLCHAQVLAGIADGVSPYSID
jgi:hypothetical protein